MTLKDIERIYTDQIAEHISAGWRVHLATMGGIQGDEKTHIDLTNDAEINRIYVRDAYTENGTNIAVIVGKDANREHIGKSVTIWNSNLEVIFRKEFVEIERPSSDNSDGWYVTPEEGKKIRHIRRDRAKLKNEDFYSGDITDTRYRDVFLRWLRKQPRMKTVRPEDISTIQKSTYEGHTVYYVWCKSKFFQIILKGE